MDEFASGVLVATVRRALAEEGIAAAVDTPGGALVPLDVKRRLLAGIAETHGLLPLLRVGHLLFRLPPDPAMSALVAADSPTELFERWSRLESFVHSRHRVVVRETGAAHLVAEHVGPPGSPPEPGENALILGVLAALLTAIGARGVTVALAPDPALIVCADGVFTAPPPGRATGRWHFSWSSLTPAIPVAGPVRGHDVASHARCLLVGDPARRWTLAALAAGLGTSPRSLQRQLQAEGGFSTLLAATRAEAAAALLMNTEHPLGMIGFVCGYADQPHFCRGFKRRTAMTPAAYRSAFRRPCPREPGRPHVGHLTDHRTEQVRA
ncbi:MULTISPECIES: helix-turn-helix transcriptional regulator [unclassified Micromonospora]|uniref:helix-turn-helix transcriptional regulator n=1 Tax=unclassified Micromonospora TaxID=2617518 RepID=UPI0036324859